MLSGVTHLTQSLFNSRAEREHCSHSAPNVSEDLGERPPRSTDSTLLTLTSALSCYYTVHLFEKKKQIAVGLMCAKFTLISRAFTLY